MNRHYLDDKDFNIEKMRSLTFEQQADLCDELRERIIPVVENNGGHMASNLGVVELTVGMYNVFDPFNDKIVWDVGHQTYVHKILTGRNDKFDTLRTENGLSGFPKLSESKADVFNTGHSSTSISAAVGYARAAKINGENINSVAVIGDGAMTGGEAFEALNDAAGHNDKITVILNDNGMFISANVGGMSRYLGKIRTRDSYIKLKKGVKKFLTAIPWLGPKLVRRIGKLKNSLKIMIIPGEFFELLGFMYLGPVDGHNIKAVTNVLEKAKRMEKPCIVHVITKKGKGYEPAETNPEKYHGVAGNVTDNSPSYSKAFGEAVCELGEKDEKVVAVTAAMPTGTKLEIFGKKYPERFFDVGISEQHAVTMCTAMALGGAKPYLVLYSTFAQRAYDQLLHDASLQRAKFVMGLDRGGVAGKDGETHQGIYDIAMCRTLPNVTVFAPSSTGELKSALHFTKKLFENEIPAGPFVIRYPAKNIFDEQENVEEIKYGKGIRVKSWENAVVTIIGLGSMVNTSVDAGKMLEKEGILTNVFNARFAKPIDFEEILQACNGVKLVVTVEDGIVTGGFGQAVKNMLLDELKNVKIINLGYPDVPIEQASIKSIYKKYGLDAEGIAETIRKNYEN